MGDLVTSALITGGSGLLGGIMDAITAKRNTDLTIKANKELADYQYNKDVEMMNFQNQYNSPKSQMSRLAEAGLNPNLVYGSGSVAGNTQGQIPKYNAPTVSYNYRPFLDAPGMLNMYNDFMIKQAQVDNLKEQKQHIALENAKDAINLKFEPGLAKLGFESKQVGLSGMKQRNELTQTMVGINRLKAQLAASTIDNLIKKSGSELVKSNFDALRSEQDYNLRRQQAEMYKIMQWGNLVARGLSSLGIAGIGGQLLRRSNVPAKIDLPKNNGGVFSTPSSTFR